MVKVIYLTLLSLCCMIIVSCKPDIKLSAEIVRNLNPSKEPLEERPLYDNVKIVKLETSPSCLIGNISRIEMNDSLIFVLEYGNLYAFTKNGKFIAKIGNKGEGPNEYITLSTFYIDNEKQLVTIIDEFKNVLINYDFKGQYVSTISVPRNSFEGCNYALLLAGDKLLTYNMMGLNNTKAYSIFDLKQNEISGKYFSYLPITVGNYMYPFSWHPMSRDGDDIDLIMPLCDTIYTYSTELSSFQAKYIVEIPQTMASKKQIREKTPSYTEDLYNLAEDGFFTGFNGIFENKTHVLLEYKYQGVVWGYFLFSKLNRTGNYYLGSWSSKDTKLPFFSTIYAYKNIFVGYTSAETLLSLKNIQNKEIQESINSLKDDDNPCLILYEFKE